MLEFLKWIPKLNIKSKLQIIDEDTLEFNKQAQIFIVSYQLLRDQLVQTRIKSELTIKIVIIDQISILKCNNPSKETKFNTSTEVKDKSEIDILTEFFMYFKRVLLLSGSKTLLDNPIDLYNIMRII